MNSVSFFKECFDLTFSNHNELCYDGLNLKNCYRTFFSRDCVECRDVYFSEDLTGCSDCFGSIGLRKKQYYIFNEPYAKEKYFEKLKEFDFGSHARAKEIRAETKKHFLKYPRKHFHTVKAYGSSGDYLYNCKNVKNSFWVETAEDVRYSQLLQAFNTTKSYDYSGFALTAEWIYESAWVGINTSNIRFTYWNYSAHDLEYCFGCHSSGNLFGCVGIRNGEYCILNKQYSKEEYFELVGKIKEQMMQIPYTDKMGREYRYGEFFPNEICPWRYNETRGQEYFPKTKEEAIKLGFSWRDADSKEYQEATIAIPDNIKDVTEYITKEVLKCENCAKNYRLIPMEVQFYRQMNISIPRVCPHCRNQGRIRELNSMDIYERPCMKCGNTMQTSYAPERPEIVYCESCYQEEVV
jgi:Zn ribbon nucleic-acid-binding protein